MESYIEFTNDEDVAILLIALEEYEINHKVSSYAQHGNIIARVDITPVGDNLIKLGYEIRGNFESIRFYLRGDGEYKEIPEGFRENYIYNWKKYKEKYAKKIVEVQPLFEIECPPNDWIEHPDGSKILVQPEVDLIIDDEDIKKIQEGTRKAIEARKNSGGNK